MEALKQSVATASRVMGTNGAGDLIWGHVSARDPDGRGIWIKEANWGLEEIRPDLVHLVSPSGEILEGKGQRHSEFPIHAEIMAARPDVGAVVHVHSPHSVALAAAGAQLRPVSHAANYFEPLGVPRFELTADLILTPELGKRLAEALGEARAVFLVNHGIAVVGADLQEATVGAIVLEMAARQQLLTAQYGSFPQWSDPEESHAKRQHIYGPGAVHAVWDYLVRRLPAS
ncbi:class II aldolase/adducin family protein [Antrihabitans sp. YC2-6]|uniref:class II aldolase/adducin family protein n=1 Tax=Antrihabitans sp. YC2-6 TaxID=2799498 RepID=UPI0018F6584D|nr:class II aldolase/adducin family protein [Antrihabitans sp. YC2-6]MBJ8348261.1 class II aldolase/adducin family protein [Antrihabitans sp. YC2-6]